MSKKNGTPTAIQEESLETQHPEAVEIRRSFNKPYSALVTIEGVAPILFHQYNCEEVEAKSRAPKGSEEKKTDNIQSYLYLVPGTKEIGIAAKNIKACLREAGRSMQDPRSKRKSAVDLIKASIFITPFVPSLGRENWDFLDKSRMTLGKGVAVPRVRPGLSEGWRLSFTINVVQPQLVPPAMLRQLLDYSGDFVGLCDSRPDYGRFKVVAYEVREFVENR